MLAADGLAVLNLSECRLVRSWTLSTHNPVASNVIACRLTPLLLLKHQGSKHMGNL